MDTTPLNLARLGELSGHARQCVFWEVDPGRPAGPHDSGPVITDPTFEKEAWLSMVMLEWGPCGQLARDGGRLVGQALYAPPTMTPRAGCLPTSPVGADAIVLTRLAAEVGADPAAAAGVRVVLLKSVVADVARRGVRAIEAFGYVDPDPSSVRIDPAELVRSGVGTAAPECTAGRCMIPAAVLVELGFELVAPHPRFPRYRMELGRDLGWKYEVEAALDSLITSPPARRDTAVAQAV